MLETQITFYFMLFLYYEQNKSKIVENQYFKHSIIYLNSNLPLKTQNGILKTNIVLYL